MTRTPDDWKSAGINAVQTHAIDAQNAVASHAADADILTTTLLAQVMDEPIDPDEVEQTAKEAKDEYKALGHAAFDAAGEVSKILSGSAIRNLRGDEPLGYSKSDGGATHDVHYGTAAQSRLLNEAVYWRLNLDEWERESCTQDRDGINPVTASGTRKFTKNVGDVTVSVVIDTRGYSPI